VPTYSGRVVVVAGVSASASRVLFVEEMVLDLRGVTCFGPILVNFAERLTRGTQ
jgi:hypothetical protein